MMLASLAHQEFEDQRVCLSHVGRKDCPEWTHEDTRRVFLQLDTEGRGYLTPIELEQGLVDLQVPMKPSDATNLFLQLAAHGPLDIYDQYGEIRIEYEQFARFVEGRQEELTKVFHQLDRNKTGSIECDDLCFALKQLGLEYNQDAAAQLMALLDTDKNGKVCLHEFRKAVLLYPSLKVDAVFERLQIALLDTGETSFIIPPIKQPIAYKLLLAGGIAGAVSRTVTAPFDRLKLMLQAQGMIVASASPAHFCVVPQITGVRQGLRAIHTEGGWKAFFRGNGANVIKILPETGIKFFAFESLKPLIAKNSGSLSIRERFTAGALAGITSQTIIYPLEIAKTRLALSTKGEYKGVLHCLGATIRSEGPLALYRGLVPASVGIIPYAGVDLSVYSTLRAKWRTRHAMETPSPVVLLSCGAVSSFCGQLIAYPLQLIRTRLQAQGEFGNKRIYSGMTDCFSKVVRQDGFSGLYRGITPNFMKAVPAVSISYLVYEKAKQSLGVETET